MVGKLRKRPTTFMKKSRANSDCSKVEKIVEVAALVLVKFRVN